MSNMAVRFVRYGALAQHVSGIKKAPTYAYRQDHNAGRL